MLRHYLLLVYRNFRRFKSTFFINLLGLSTGLACTLLIYLWVRDEMSVDKFHEKDSQLFQVIQNYPIGGNFIVVESTPDPLAKSLEEDFPEIEAAVKSTQAWHEPRGVLTAGKSRVKADELYVTPNFMNIFSYQLVYGNRDQALKDKYGVLLSDELALKLFHTTEDLVGKTIEWNRNLVSGSFTITGIFSKVPSNSTARFDLLFNYEIFYDAMKSRMFLDSWENSNGNTYVVLREGTDIGKLNEKVKNFCKEKLMKTNANARADFAGTIYLQKYSDRYLYNNYENGIPSGGRIAYVKLFSIIAVFILLIACINFMNLSTAKASRRIKEIGIKKAIGAQRKSLIFQYMLESVLMAFLSLGVAILMADLLITPFNQITGKNISLIFDSNLVLSAILITLVTGVIAGSYPALYLSGFNPAIVLKGKMNTSIGEAWTRKGLVVFQFAISIVLIVSVLVVYKQVSFIQAKNLGFNKEQIIQFASEDKLTESFEAFKTEAQKIPGVVKVTSCAVSSVVDNTNATGGVFWDGKREDQKMEFGNLEIGDDFVETLEMKIIEGRSFSKYESEKSKIFNKTAINSMGLIDPIGKTVKLWGQERQIIGVVEDFHFESLYKKVKPCFVIYNQKNLQNILIKIEAGNETAALSSIEKLYHRFNPGLVFEYTFLDSNYREMYASEQRVGILSKYFAGIAIILSCLGLFGLAAFTAERRLKEIGIRKVLGASEIGIIALLSGSFSRIVFVAVVIALPISYLAANYWLNNFAYRITLQWWYFAGAGFIAMIIAWLTVGSQALKAARINPTKCLKDE